MARIVSYQTVYGKPSKGNDYAYWNGYDHALTAASEGTPKALLEYARQPFARGRNGTAMVAVSKLMEGAIFLGPLRAGGQSYFVVSWMRAFSEGGQSRANASEDMPEFKLNDGRHYTLVHRCYFNLEDWEANAPEILHEYLRRVSKPLPTLTEDPAGVEELPRLTWLDGSCADKTKSKPAVKSQITGADLLNALRAAPAAINLELMPDQADFLQKCAGAMTRIPKSARGIFNAAYGLKLAQDDIAICISESGGDVPALADLDRDRWSTLAKDIKLNHRRAEIVPAIQSAIRKDQLRSYLFDDGDSIDFEKVDRSDAHSHALILTAFWNAKTNREHRRALIALRGAGFTLFTESLSDNAQKALHDSFAREGKNGEGALLLHRILAEKWDMRDPNPRDLGPRHVERLAAIARAETNEDDERLISQDARHLLVSLAGWKAARVIEHFKLKNSALSSKKRDMLSALHHKSVLDVLEDYRETEPGDPLDFATNLMWSKLLRPLVIQRQYDEGTQILDEVADIILKRGNWSDREQSFREAADQIIRVELGSESDHITGDRLDSLVEALDMDCAEMRILAQELSIAFPRLPDPLRDVVEARDHARKPALEPDPLPPPTAPEPVLQSIAPKQIRQPSRAEQDATADRYFDEVKRLFDFHAAREVKPNPLQVETRLVLLSALKVLQTGGVSEPGDPEPTMAVDVISKLLKDEFASLPKGPFSIDYGTSAVWESSEYLWLLELHKLAALNEPPIIKPSVLRDQMLFVSQMFVRDETKARTIVRAAATDGKFDGVPGEVRPTVKQILVELTKLALSSPSAMGWEEREDPFIQRLQDALLRKEQRDFLGR